MNIKMSAISASVLLMLAGGVMAADEYEVEFKGKVTSDSCVLTGSGKGLVVELTPVQVSTLQNSTQQHNRLRTNDFAKVICAGDMESITIGWGNVETISSAFVNQPAIVPDRTGDYAAGTYIDAILQSSDYIGETFGTRPGSNPVSLKLRETADGVMEANIQMTTAYVTAKNGAEFEKVTAGPVSAFAPIVLTYE